MGGQADKKHIVSYHCILRNPEIILCDRHSKFTPKEFRMTEYYPWVYKGVITPSLGGRGVTPTDFIWGCSTQGSDPLPFHILNIGKLGPFNILNFKN